MSDSYVLIASGVNFCLYGTLQEDYSDRQTVDTAGMLVRFNGLDTAFDEQSPFDAMASELLVFIGVEILSVFEWQLVSESTYLLYCLRGRFATSKADHTAGAEVFVVPKKSLKVLTHDQFQVGNSVDIKTAARSLSDVGPLSDPINHVITGRVFTQCAPTNLRVNNDLRNPSFSLGEGIRIDWTLTDSGARFPPGVKISTILEFWDGESLLGTREITSGVSTLNLSAEELLALLGGTAQPFTLQAKTKIVDAFFDLFSSSAVLNIAYE